MKTIPMPAMHILIQALKFAGREKETRLNEMLKIKNRYITVASLLN